MKGNKVNSRFRGRSQTTLTSFWLFLINYLPSFTLSIYFVKVNIFWLPTTFVNVVCEGPLSEISKTHLCLTQRCIRQVWQFRQFQHKIGYFFVLLQAFDSLYRSAYPNVKKQTCHIDFDIVDIGVVLKLRWQDKTDRYLSN